jgi:hypothetical protein
MALANQATSSRTLRLRQQIVVPASIRMRPQERRPPSLPDHSYVGFLSCHSVDCVESVLLAVNSAKRVLSSKSPTSGHIANVRDVFMSTLAVRFANARNLTISHRILLDI